MNTLITKPLIAAAAFGAIIVPLNAKEHEEHMVETGKILPNASSSWVNQEGSTM
jgi:hypothetical protein